MRNLQCTLHGIYKPAILVVLISTRSFAAAMAPPPAIKSREIFSVAPMMAHTHRHYHYFFRLLSRRAHLYTEMIPANQVISHFNLEIGAKHGTIATDEQIMQVLNRPPRDQGINNIYELLRISTPPASPLVLQLGGRDPEALAEAAAIGAALGYDSINLNCGCPSNAVSGGDRSSGVSLMKDPSHVATCLERMSERLASIADLTENKKVHLTVKHRLGVAEASEYDADADKQLDDAIAFKTCRNFVKTISTNSAVSTLHVHARLGLVGQFATSGSSETTLWVPGQAAESTGKVDHKRLQYQAQKQARSQTIQNRSVPPLRPNVVNMLADDMPHLQFVTNGGIKSMDSLDERLLGTPSNVVGAMIGRAVINHPCSFAGVDSLWGEVPTSMTRQAVLEDFIGYCQREEERVQSLGIGTVEMESLRRKLAAVPFHLFAGEEGSNQYQRRIRKLINRPFATPSYLILIAALAEVPAVSRGLPVTNYTSIDDIKDFEIVQRSGPLQRTIR
jgi:tRNA-dihydrouridine synthase A